MLQWFGVGVAAAELKDVGMVDPRFSIHENQQLSYPMQNRVFLNTRGRIPRFMALVRGSPI